MSSIHPFINPQNEIKINEKTDVHETIDFIINLFTNKKYDKIIISGLNKTICKVLLIVEHIKSNIPGLHQLTEIGSITKDNNVNNIVPKLSITLTFTTPDINNIGYQKPLNVVDISNIKQYMKKHSYYDDNNEIEYNHENF